MEVFVYENWSDTNPEKLGTLFVDGNKGKEVVSFEYNIEWLQEHPCSFFFDPDLALYQGRQYTPLGKTCLVFSQILALIAGEGC